MTELRAAWMYPDLLNLHGERGNAMALTRMAKHLDIPFTLDRLDDLDEELLLESYDLLLFNAGEIREIQIISEVLSEKRKPLDTFVESGGVLLATGTTGLLFGGEVTRRNGSHFQGLGYLDFSAEERQYVEGRDLHYDMESLEIYGSQIQMANIRLGPHASPLGTVQHGFGNCGEKDEGARYKNLIFTNCLGPALIKNPWLTQYLFRIAALRKGEKWIEKDIDTSLEFQSLTAEKKMEETLP